MINGEPLQMSTRMEAERRCLFCPDHGDTEICRFYKASEMDSSNFTEDDGQDIKDDNDIFFINTRWTSYI